MILTSTYDSTVTARGSVKVCFTCNGATVPVVEHSNILAYGAADVIAQLLAGVADAAPSAIGVVYGTAELPSLEHPSATRAHTIEALAEQIGAIGGNMAIMPLSLTPSISVSDADLYGGNVATFSANTGAVASYAFSGSPFCGELGTLDPVYFYQLVLLSGIPGAYTVFARATLLSGGVYKARPDGYHLAVQWPVTIK